MDLQATLTPQLLAEVREFWFAHIDSREASILPKMPQMMRWFTSDPENDAACKQRFLHALDAIKSSGASAEYLIALLDESAPDDWLSLVLLLDQVSRNCFRGADSALVFTVFDPLALGVARRAVSLGIPTSPGFKYFVSRRMWFYLPFMHSEDLAVHDDAVKLYQQMGDELRALTDSPSSAGTGQEKECAEIFANNREAVEGLLKTNLDYEVKHRDIIAQFGRYPHRNEPLGRESTKDEVDYLANGGETFSAKS